MVNHVNVNCTMTHPPYFGNINIPYYINWTDVDICFWIDDENYLEDMYVCMC